MKLTLALSFIAGTTAFAPLTNKVSTTVLEAASGSQFADSLGVVAPTGFFDPFGISANWDQETFERYQAGEITNGRVAMAGVLGYVVPEIFRLPGEITPGLKFADVPNGMAALKVIPGSFWVALFLSIGCVNFLNYENSGSFTEWQEVDMDAETLVQRKQNEISNGRLAMLAFMELARHDLTMGPDENLITGLPFLYQ
uniref:Uncharacterized protein n=1 Tax=Amphora coffeiformis TaxID=265554 RepID=A0A7S3L741_9STRA